MKPWSDPIRVVVRSDEPIVHAGLSTLLDAIPDVERVVEHDDLTLEGVDVVLLDLTESVDLDISLVDRLVHVATAAVVAVTHDLRPELADRALARGVDGCISLTASSDELGAVLQSAAWGDLSGRRDPAAVDYTDNPASDSAPSRTHVERCGLSPREEEVLRLIATGLPNQQIADDLFLSINSVKTHIRSVYRKIEVDSRSRAVRWAIEHGVVGVHPAGD